MNGIDRRALLRGLAALPVLSPALTLSADASAPLRRDLDGMGIIFIDGRPVAFDSNARHDISASDQAVVFPGALAPAVVNPARPSRAQIAGIYRSEQPVTYIDAQKSHGWPEPMWLEAHILGRVVKGNAA